MTAIPFLDGWSYRLPLGPFASADPSDPGAEPAAVRLPHDALRDAERRADVPGKGAGAYYPNGAFTYLKTFDVPAEWAGKVVRLEVQGAFRRAQVFCNNEAAGVWADGYARFFVDLTPYLRHGESNDLRVEVRSGQDSRWYSGAGLHRPVLLHVDEPVHVAPDGVRVTTVRVEDDQAVVEVATTVTNASLVTRTVDVATALFGPDGAAVDGEQVPATAAPGDQIVVRQRFYVLDPALWGPDSPSLYTARVALKDLPAGATGAGGSVVAQVPGAAFAASGADALTIGEPTTVAFGIRTVTVDPRKGLRINGQKVLLRGACIHHDNGPLGAAATGRAEERRVELLKEAGFNAIRAAHNPLSVPMLEACDRLGMLVMDEAFDTWTRFKTPYDYAADFDTWWERDIESLVAKDYNHPSVIMYSIGNEIVEVGTPHGSRTVRRLVEKVRALDPTRPVTNGINAFLAVIDEPGGPFGPGTGINQAAADNENFFAGVSASAGATRRTAESSSVLDVLGMNYGESRYELDQALFPNRVIVGSETFPAQIGRLWPLVESNPNVIGDFTWTGWDYLGEVGIGKTHYGEPTGGRPGLEHPFPALTAWCGDIDITGHRRPLSYYREIVFGLCTEPYLAVQRPEVAGQPVRMRPPWGWSDTTGSWTWPGFEGTEVDVEVYTGAEEVALLLDGVEIDRAVVGSRCPKVAELRATYRPGTLEAVAYSGGAEVGRTSLTTADHTAARLVATADRAEIVEGFEDLAYIAIELRDPDGNIVTGADRPVTVHVDGAGELAGMCSANPVTTERFVDPTWSTFEGRALAVVRPIAVGQVQVRVEADGLDPAEVTVIVR